LCFGFPAVAKAGRPCADLATDGPQVANAGQAVPIARIAWKSPSNP
jgi:hypothetical protein